jgi:hypothetical protein
MADDLTLLWSDLDSFLDDQVEKIQLDAAQLIEKAVELLGKTSRMIPKRVYYLTITFLETELEDEIEIIEVLEQALFSRQRLLQNDVEKASSKYKKDLQLVNN